MNITIKTIPQKKLVGIQLKMNLEKNQTFELWNKFMPKRNEITNRVSSDLYSVQKYDFPDFSHFTPHTLFYKWAAAEVADFNSIPEGMEPLLLTGGTYAVSAYRGIANGFAEFFQTMLMHLSKQEYLVDNSHPHFELLGEKYKNNNPESEEEIWIPVKKI